MTNFTLPERNGIEISEITKMSNEKLCEIVVAYRYLGMLKEQSVMAMEELGNRRKNGDTYEYEKEIEKKHQELPKIKLDMKEIMKAGPSIFSGLSSMVNKK